VLTLKLEAADKRVAPRELARRRLARMAMQSRWAGSTAALRMRAAARGRMPQLTVALDFLAVRLSATRTRQVSPPAWSGAGTAPATQRELAALRLERRVRAVELALDDLAAELREPTVEPKHYESAMSALAPRLQAAAASAAAQLREMFAFGDGEGVIRSADFDPSGHDPSSPAMYLEDPHGLLGDRASPPRSRRPALMRRLPRS
jgi:hypothetical protein